MSHWNTSREDWPSPSDLAEELAWSHYLQTHDEREFRYYEWCYEHYSDPEATETMVAYETYYQERLESQ